MRVNVDLIAVEFVESPQNVLCRVFNVVTASVIWKVVFQRRVWQFLGKDVNFVEEENDRGACKPA